MVSLGFAALGCKAQVPAITEPFADEFERAEVGPTWTDTGGGYKTVAGKLYVSGAKNHPLWLRKKLPRDVVIELDAMAKNPMADLKIEVFGDGESFDADGNRYDPTGYVFVFGGWHNSNSIIGRLGEHDAEVKAQRQDKRVEPGRVYRWTITRKGSSIDWKIDGEPFLSWTDPQPLEGKGHEFFAVNNYWASEAHYDNLRIRPAQ